MQVEGKYAMATPRMHTVMLALLNALVGALGVELKPHIPHLLRHCMSVFREDESITRGPTQQVCSRVVSRVVFQTACGSCGLNHWRG